ncbi:1D-myo-inositol 2-acetamido-2-deoxy-alpha-D-glucopyranoside deacetylase [compost metagenome]
MKKIIFGIFAHPDDEAFGPSGALLMETKAGAELHLITLTSGQAGTNPDNHPDLGTLRTQEWHTAGTLLGATSMHALGFKDGQLDNASLLEAAQRIESIVSEVLAQHHSNLEIEFMTMDTNGITGHIDHIVASRAALLAFYRLKEKDSRLTRIRLACLPLSVMPTADITWLFADAGRPNDEIDEIVDARHLRDEIITVMRAHHTQRADYQTNLARQGEMLGMNYFIVKS